MHPALSVLITMLLISLVAFVTYGLDKSKAKRHLWRIPESVLLGLGEVLTLGFVLLLAFAIGFLGLVVDAQ